MTGEPVIHFEDVAFAHPGGATILRGLNLSIATGETTAIVGRSGAGKTTILKTGQPPAVADRRAASLSRAATRRMGSDPAAPTHRLRVAGRRALPAHDRRGKRVARPAARALAGRSHASARTAAPRDGRAARRRRSRPGVPANCREGSGSGSARPRARHRSTDPADGRTVRRARSDYAHGSPARVRALQQQLRTTVVMVTHDMARSVRTRPARRRDRRRRADRLRPPAAVARVHGSSRAARCVERRFRSSPGGADA